MPPKRSPRKDPAEDPEPQGDAEAPSDAPPFAPLKITTHRALMARQREIFSRLEQRPDLAALMVINPALAFRAVGVTTSPEITDHILRTVQYPPALRERREQLIKELTEALGEPPEPNNPVWVARALFEQLKLAPLATEGQTPSYRPAIEADALARLNALRPKPRPRDRYKRPRPPSGGGSMQLAPSKATARRLDLDAKLPPLKELPRPPKGVELEALYFYKDSHPVARGLLELAIIEHQAFPIQSADGFRKVQRGETKSALHRWIGRISFAKGRRDEPDG
jgi:hypothetical protein